MKIKKQNIVFGALLLLGMSCTKKEYIKTRLEAPAATATTEEKLAFLGDSMVAVEESTKSDLDAGSTTFINDYKFLIQQAKTLQSSLKVSAVPGTEVTQNAVAADPVFVTVGGQEIPLDIYITDLEAQVSAFEKQIADEAVAAEEVVAEDVVEEAKVPEVCKAFLQKFEDFDTTFEYMVDNDEYYAHEVNSFGVELMSTQITDNTFLAAVFVFDETSYDAPPEEKRPEIKNVRLVRLVGEDTIIPFYTSQTAEISTFVERYEDSDPSSEDTGSVVEQHLCQLTWKKGTSELKTFIRVNGFSDKDSLSLTDENGEVIININFSPKN